MVRRADVLNEALHGDVGLFQIHFHPASVELPIVGVVASGNDMQRIAGQLRPHFPKEECKGHQIGQMMKRTNEQQPPWLPGLPNGLIPMHVNPVRQHEGSGPNECGIARRHCRHRIDAPPCISFESLPQPQLPLRFPPISPDRAGGQLGVEVQGDVVLHQDGSGGATIRGVLRKLGVLQLRDLGLPLAHHQAKRCPKGLGSELVHRIRNAGLAAVRPVPPDLHYFRTNRKQLLRRLLQFIDEVHQHLIAKLGGVPHQVVHPHGATVAEWKGRVTGSNQDDRSSAPPRSRKHRNVAGPGCGHVLRRMDAKPAGKAQGFQVL